MSRLDTRKTQTRERQDECVSDGSLCCLQLRVGTP